MSRLYRIQEFAALAGVTVKALRHYERIGLLKPSRTSSGYRTYTNMDLERLEQIVALKFLGFPLQQIKSLLDKTALDLPAALRAQRLAIEGQRDRLGRAVKANRAVEDVIERGEPVDPALLSRIIEVIGMDDAVETMKKYYTEEGWQKRRRYYEEGPSEEWQTLYRDVNMVLNEDPGSEKAQAVAERWLALSIKASLGDPDVQTDSMTAWADREHWPPAMRERIAAFNLEEVFAFIKRAAESSNKKYFSEEAWSFLLGQRDRSVEEVSRFWQARVDLFHDIERTLGEDPAGERAQSLAARWTVQIDSASGGRTGVRAGLMKQWADRRSWSAVQCWQAEGLHMMSYERFLRAADFIDRAVEQASRTV